MDPQISQDLALLDQCEEQIVLHKLAAAGIQPSTREQVDAIMKMAQDLYAEEQRQPSIHLKQAQQDPFLMAANALSGHVQATRPPGFFAAQQAKQAAQNPDVFNAVLRLKVAQTQQQFPAAKS